MVGRVVKVKSWDTFKKLIIEHRANCIAYNIEQTVPAGNLTVLRLILPIEGSQYVFIDTALGDRLRRTGIPLHRDKMGNLYIKDEDILDFVRAQVKRKDLNLYSYWTI